MKYRIENGEIKIPASEFNRLNDEFERLEAKANEMEDREIALQESIRAQEVLIVKESYHFGLQGERRYVDLIWSDKNDFSRRVREESDHYCDDKIERELAIKQTELFAEGLQGGVYNEKEKFSKMTTREFKLWKKKYLETTPD